MLYHAAIVATMRPAMRISLIVFVMYLSMYLPNDDCLIFSRLIHFIMTAVPITDGKYPMTVPNMKS